MPRDGQGLVDGRARVMVEAGGDFRGRGGTYMHGKIRDRSATVQLLPAAEETDVFGGWNLPPTDRSVFRDGVHSGRLFASANASVLRIPG